MTVPHIYIWCFDEDPDSDDDGSRYFESKKDYWLLFGS
jgi:hypothetical protein